MTELKTKPTDQNPLDFLNSVEPESKRIDGLKLLEIFKQATREEPRMWGTGMVGFGMYHYKSERSRQEGDWPLVAFSPRKQSLSLYILMYGQQHDPNLEKLGKHKTGVGCLYINKLADVDLGTLRQLVKNAYQRARQELIK